MSSRPGSVACALAMFALAATAQDRDAERDAIASWQGALRANLARLEQGAWARAETAGRELLEDLMRRLKEGEGSALLLGAALAQLAVAEAELGRAEEAAWHWDLARQLDPAFAAGAIGALGPAAARLERRPLRRRGEAAPGGVAHRLDQVSPPALLETPHIVFRASAEILRSFPRDLSVEVVVGSDGRVRDPVLSGSLINPGPMVLSLETLLSWRLEPAAISGAAVPVLLELDLPLTRGAVDRLGERLARSSAAEPR
ncbi:MAG TPA: hypothetical protein VMT85_14465 [Thermoanaerobaculia bacterium]|nr:hypothetical protein [Thermoanaerobaculia bacterium]